MIEISIPREIAGLLGAHIEAHFETSTLRAGLALYADKKVTHIWKDQFNIIHAIVSSPPADAKLQLDLDFFLASECRCGERFCPHMAAVFLALYAQHENPQRWVMDVESIEAASDSAQMSAKTPTPHEYAELRPEPGSQALQPEQWGELIAKELNMLYRRQTDRFRIDIFYYTAFKKLSARAEMLGPETGPYFRAYCAILVMLHAEQHFTEHGKDYPLPYYQRLAADISDHMIERLRDAIGLMDQSAARTDANLRACALAMRRLMSGRFPVPAPAALQWSEVHRYVCGQLMNETEWLQDEECRLAELAEQAPWTASENADQLAHMGAHISWLLGRDEEAMRKLAGPHSTASGLVLSYMETHYKTGSWMRLGQWLEFSLPRMRRFPADAFNRALTIWREYAARTGSMDSYSHALAALLPRSYPQYTEHLLQTGQREQWVNFHLLNGVLPAKIDHTQLRQLEQQHPALLLPIYHQAIARQLSLKNRTAYREAVKLLKRLKDLYMGASAPQRFQFFVRELTAKYHRLHAFIEELEKGKLLV